MHVRPALLPLVLLMAACSHDPGAPSSGSRDITSGSAMAGWRAGDIVTVRGRVSTTPWQHLMTGVEGKTSAYFDLAGGREQTVVYWKAPPECAGELEVTGTVLEVRGGSKRPGETKVDESYRELQLDVHEARCLGG